MSTHEEREQRWVTGWTASLSGAGGAFAGPDATIRQTMRTVWGGDAVRIRISNPYSYAPLRVDAASIGLPGSTLPDIAGEPVALRFRGASGVLVHPGDAVWSDPAVLPVPTRGEVVISVHVSAPTEVSGHPWGNRFSWTTMGAVGDLTAQSAGAAFRPWTTGSAWVDAIDVRTSGAGSIVAVGDSITDGAGADFGTDTRWTDLLTERTLALDAADPRRLGIVNAGIGGNTVAGFGNNEVGPNVVSRLERDALNLSGIRAVIIAAGSNDLYLGGTADALIAEWERIAERIHVRGMRALIATIVPRGGGYGWAAPMERERERANAWIHRQSVYDGVIDFVPALDDPQEPGSLRPDLDADGTHPNSKGYRAMAEGVDLDVLI
jgi:lysophospholipase L1-like esterase